MLPRPSRTAPTLLALLAALVLAAPVAAQTGAPDERQAAEEALAEAQALSDGHGIRTGRELSVALVRLAAQRQDLSRADRQEADELLARPTDADDTAQTGGPYSASARVLRNCSAHFCVHWVDSTADAPPPADADSCPTPDYVDRVRTALEQSYAVENGQLAWRAPVPDGGAGGNALTDVYLKQLNGSGGGLYGYAATDSGSGRTRPAFLVLDDDYSASEFPQYGGDPSVPIEVTAAHEYNHVLQYAYDILQDPWMYESTATWSEEKVFPADDDYHGYMKTWASNPGQPITSASGTKMYGTAIWNHWLEQRYGADVVRRAWEQSVASGGFAPGAYDLAIKAVAGSASSFDANLGDFAAATAAWEGADSGISEGARFADPVTHVALQVKRQADPLALGDFRSATLSHTGYAIWDVPVPADPSDPYRVVGSVRQGAADGAVGTIALVGIKGADVTKVTARTGAGGNATVTMPGDPSRFDRLMAVAVNADVSKSGFNGSADDWIWTRDGQTARVTLQLAPPGAGDTPVGEPLAPTATSAAPDPACGTTSVEREPPVLVDPAPTPSPTATVSPTVTPAPTVVPPPPPVATSVRLSRSTTKLATVARKGVLSLFARTSKAGRLGAKATVDGTTSKRLKVGRRTTAAGRGSRTATAPARLKINVKLTRKLRAAIKRNRRRALKVRVAVRFTPADGTSAVTRLITIKLRP